MFKTKNLIGSIKRAISDVPLDHFLILSFEINDEKLIFNVLVNEKANEDDFENLRIAQTEVLADFPDGEITEFQLNFYRIIDNKGTSIFPGNILYASKSIEKDNISFSFVKTESCVRE